MTRKYRIKTRKVEKIEVDNCYITAIKGPNNEIIRVSACSATAIETRNWCIQQHFDRYGNKTAPYALARQGRGFVYMHRFLWEEFVGPIPPGLELDHINGDTLDNQLENLRLVTHKENQNNQKHHREERVSKTSKYLV